MTDAAFEYHLRVSLRARNVRLKVSMQDGLEVIVPRGYNIADLPDVLQRSSRWIRKTFDRVETQRKLMGETPAWRLPERIELPAVRAVWQVEAQNSEARAVQIREWMSERLLVSGRIDNERACKAALGHWLTSQAQRRLLPLLMATSERLGFQVKGATIRRQRTRWASCSSRRTISLNAKLLLLSPELVDYIFLHELCHLTHMNHSRRFWALVHQHDPDFRQKDKRLHRCWETLPRWVS